LTRQPQTHASNPHWPPGKHQSMAGPAHGLHMYESEGEGLGRCMYVLMGGRSGGHQAAVLASVKYSIIYTSLRISTFFSRPFIQNSHLSQLVAYVYFFNTLST
jgi:hypothetical protein